MAKNKMDMRAAPRDESGNLLPQLYGNGTIHDATGNDTSHKIPSFKRDYEREIYLFCVGAGRAVSRQEICKALGLKKTTWLTNKIEWLVEEGFLTRVHGTWKNGFLIYLYEVNQQA